MLAMSASDAGSTGAPEMSVFHALLAGKARAPLSGAPAPSEATLKLDVGLGVAVDVRLVEEGTLAELANSQGREGKPRRLVDRRPAYQQKGTR